MNWGIEKRESFTQNDKPLINDWGSSKENTPKYIARGPSSNNMLEEVEAQGAFSTFQPYLTADISKALDTTDGKEAARLFFEEIDKLEREWGLI